jgi:hypothetical protein
LRQIGDSGIIITTIERSVNSILGREATAFKNHGELKIKKEGYAWPPL